MKLHELQRPAGSTKNRKRVGRGPASGWGQTSARGHKGQNARAGGQRRSGFEGGQMPMKRRLPKRGFTNIFAKQYALINIRDLDRFENNTTVDPTLLISVGLIRKVLDGVKVLGDGTLTKSLVVKVHRVSDTAKEKIEGAGGKVELI
ncbi:MAG TPA: 50S ribosomal protein L15 [Thermodesulfobacteriota bacterium]|nr:50S ribosomal protein L15 [Thermodesulfobacteriota bacterium]HQO78632.1 50S ribosomal protein L15 [Thermodesulfobacteriota bacterium]